MRQKILVGIAGLGGSIGTTVATGLACKDLHDITHQGRAMLSPRLNTLNANLPSVDQIALTGWDLKDANMYALATECGICDLKTLTHGKTALTRLTPRKGHNPETEPLGEWIQREASSLRDHAKTLNATTIVLVNLCPTEPYSKQVSDTAVPWNELTKVRAAFPGVTTSRSYFRLAIEAGAHYINFTPNLAETPLLQEMAKSKQLAFCGRDGKTGQTFLKAVIAPALRDRNLQIDGWFSTNLLGNTDGLALSSPDTSETKVKTKAGLLSKILGYHLGGSPHSKCHQVHIHYYPPRGDAKEAWDNIDFTGFLGQKMQLKLNLLGRDSILAAPLVIDLILLVSYASEQGQCGPLNAFSYYFKDPLANGLDHSVSRQLDALCNFLIEIAE